MALVNKFFLLIGQLFFAAPAVSEQQEDKSAPLAPPRSLVARLRRDPGLVALLLLMLVTLPFVTQRIYASDEIKYFSYLQSVIFDHDLDFTNQYNYWKQHDEKKYGALVDSMLKPDPHTGLPINEAPIGSALLWSPFFLLAHAFTLIARGLGAKVEADGYSQPYITAVCYASFLYGWAGLFLIYAMLRRLFAWFPAALGVAAAWLATPAFFYMVIAPPWSHSGSLFAVSLFLFIWYRTRPAAIRTRLQWAALGLSAGLMMLMREQDALFLIIPGVETLLALWPRWRENLDLQSGGAASPSLVTRHSSLVTRLPALIIGWVCCLACAFIAFIPQLIVYRITSGAFRPSSTVSDKFTWWSPHFFEVLFSPRYGLITWTPLIIVALVGLFFLAQKDRTAALCFLVAVFAQVFIAGAFLTWMGASSFGQRRFVNITAIVAFGVCALASWLLAKGWLRWQVAGIAALFVLWNFGLILQYSAFWTSADREYGLRWPDVLAGQFRAYARIPELAWRFVFDRKSFQSPTAPT